MVDEKQNTKRKVVHGGDATPVGMENLLWKFRDMEGNGQWWTLWLSIFPQGPEGLAQRNRPLPGLLIRTARTRLARAVDAEVTMGAACNGYG